MGRDKRTKPLASLGQFMPVPHRVLKSPAYRSLSHPAARLLWDIAIQCHVDDNGRLLTSYRHMSEIGWTSADTLNRARNELEAAGFIYKTVQGHRPNKASWWAITWMPLSRLNGYDAGAESGFEQWMFEKSKPP